MDGLTIGSVVKLQVGTGLGEMLIDDRLHLGKVTDRVNGLYRIEYLEGKRWVWLKSDGKKLDYPYAEYTILK